MTTRRLEIEPVSDTARIVEVMQRAVRDEPESWFLALMAAIRQWPLPEETANGRTYRYLIAGEAFDWLVLAERLCEELAGLVPEEEIEALLFNGRPPVEMAEDDWKTLLGAKYRPHLNFVYGVHVESALQLAIRDEVNKEHRSRVWANGQAEDEAFLRAYGKPRPELLAQFWTDTSRSPADGCSLTDLNEFTYWLFRYRVNNSDPARVASDTRKGMAQLAHLNALRQRSWRELE
jgi:hypothetical protein